MHEQPAADEVKDAPQLVTQVQANTTQAIVEHTEKQEPAPLSAR